MSADLAARELGWVAGVAVAAVAAVALWPVHQRDRVRAAAATVLREAAVVLTAPAATRDLSAARAAGAALNEHAGVVYRPAGSITAEQRAGRTRDRGPPARPAYRADGRGRHLGRRRHAAGVHVAVGEHRGHPLRERPRARGGVRRPGRCQHARRRARARHTARSSAGPRRVSPPTVRPASSTASGPPFRFVGSRSRRWRSPATPRSRPTSSVHHDTVPPRFSRAAAALRAHCNLQSVRFRNTARAGLGLALAVLVAKTTSVEHTYWVVLGALAVLRSNTLGTGTTALQALAGALLGFGVADAVLVTVGGDDAVLWILLPLVVFLAAYTPGAVNFVVGPGAVRGVRRRVVRHPHAPGLAHRTRARAERRDRCRHQRRRRRAALAPKCPRRRPANLRRPPAGRRDRVRLSLAATSTASRPPGAPGRGIAADARDRAVAALEDLTLEHGGGPVDREGVGRAAARRRAARSRRWGHHGPVRVPARRRAVHRPGPRWRTRVAACAPASETGRPARARGCPGRGRCAGRHSRPRGGGSRCLRQRGRPPISPVRWAWCGRTSTGKVSDHQH